MHPHTLVIRSAAVVMLGMMIVEGCAPAVPSVTMVPPTAASREATPPEATATSTVQPTPTAIANTPCIPIEESAPADLPLSGVWVRNEYIPYLEDPLTARDIRIPLKGGAVFGQWDGDAAVSPDGKYLAYIDQYFDPVVTYRPVKRILRVISSSGQSLQIGRWKEDWQYIIGWADNQTIGLFTSSKAVVTLNPFTGEWQSLSEPAWLVAMGYTGDKYSFSNYNAPVFAPLSDRVEVPAEAGGFDIRDLRSGDVLFHSAGARGAGSEPRPPISWSADGSIFTFISGGHLITVAQGQPASDLDLGPLGAALDMYGGIKLSPDAHKTAFTGTNFSPDETGTRLFVYDSARSKLYSLCTAEYVVLGFRQMAWSPDSRFLVLPITEATTDWWQAQEFDVLVDTQELRAFKLISGQQQHRLFWLAAP